MKALTQKQIREETEHVDRVLGRLVPWVETLNAARRRYLLAGDAHTVRLIDDGIEQYEGRPADPALEPFDRRFPGLVKGRKTIEDARERRELLEQQRLSQSDLNDASSRAQERATAINERVTALTKQSAALRAAIAEAATLALDVAVETRAIWEATIALDKACDHSDIPRPQTPQVEAIRVRGAGSLSVLLSDYFTGGTPHAVSSDLIRGIRGNAVA
jgi:hypothetical protein